MPGEEELSYFELFAVESPMIKWMKGEGQDRWKWRLNKKTLETRSHLYFRWGWNIDFCGRDR